jgi:hypothetical protein
VRVRTLGLGRVTAAVEAPTRLNASVAQMVHSQLGAALRQPQPQPQPQQAAPHPAATIGAALAQAAPPLPVTMEEWSSSSTATNRSDGESRGAAAAAAAATLPPLLPPEAADPGGGTTRVEGIESGADEKATTAQLRALLSATGLTPPPPPPPSGGGNRAAAGRLLVAAVEAELFFASEVHAAAVAASRRHNCSLVGLAPPPPPSEAKPPPPPVSPLWPIVGAVSEPAASHTLAIGGCDALAATPLAVCALARAHACDRSGTRAWLGLNEYPCVLGGACAGRCRGGALRDRMSPRPATHAAQAVQIRRR